MNKYFQPSNYLNYLRQVAVPKLLGRTFAVSSYAQSGEDLIAQYVFQAIEPYKPAGMYMDIGAHNPTLFNNTYIFYRRGWRGINIDPLSDNMALFRRQRPRDTNICAGLGTESGQRTFYRMDAATLSTFNHETALDYERHGYHIATTEEVPFLSVHDLLKQHPVPTNLDLLTVDIEDTSWPVISALFQEGIRPRIMMAETVTHSNRLADSRKDQGLIDRIVGANYRLYADTFLNSIFVSEEYLSHGA